MIDIPVNFKKNKTYPLVIFLHGGIDTDQKSICGVRDKENHFTCQKMIHI